MLNNDDSERVCSFSPHLIYIQANKLVLTCHLNLRCQRLTTSGNEEGCSSTSNINSKILNYDSTTEEQPAQTPRQTPSSIANNREKNPEEIGLLDWQLPVQKKSHLIIGKLSTCILKITGWYISFYSVCQIVSSELILISITTLDRVRCFKDSCTLANWGQNSCCMSSYSYWVSDGIEKPPWNNNSQLPGWTIKTHSSEFIAFMAAVVTMTHYIICALAYWNVWQSSFFLTLISTNKKTLGNKRSNIYKWLHKSIIQYQSWSCYF